jgi:hypothetical protein
LTKQRIGGIKQKATVNSPTKESPVKSTSKLLSIPGDGRYVGDGA